MMDIKDTIRDLLMSTGRDGMDMLVDYMEHCGFFEAPCSGKHHLSVEGGLAQHSLNVYQALKELCESFCVGAEINDDSIIICSILHDLGKAGQYNKPNYVQNILKSGAQSQAEPFKTNPELIYEEHEIRSVIITSQYIYLKEEEQHAILHHNGLFGKLDTAFSSHYDDTKLSFLLHTADMYASRFMEE